MLGIEYTFNNSNWVKVANYDLVYYNQWLFEISVVELFRMAKKQAEFGRV